MRGRESQIGEIDTFDARASDWQPEPHPTHYIPAFTVFRGREQHVQHAACGQFVSASEHSTEPTCAECLAYVESDPYKDKSADELF